MNKDQKVTFTTPYWITLMMVYIVLFFTVGYITFYYNNDFATNDQIIEKIEKYFADPGLPPIQQQKQDYIEKLIKSQFQDDEKVKALMTEIQEISLVFDSVPPDGLGASKSNLVKDLLKRERDNYDSVNAIASQSFNVVLGTFLGFLSAMVITRKSREE